MADKPDFTMNVLVGTVNRMLKKFCADSVFETAIDKTGFVAPVPLAEALERTVRHEFIESHEHEGVFISE